MDFFFPALNNAAPSNATSLLNNCAQLIWLLPFSNIYRSFVGNLRNFSAKHHFSTCRLKLRIYLCKGLAMHRLHSGQAFCSCTLCGKLFVCVLHCLKFHYTRSHRVNDISCVFLLGK